MEKADRSLWEQDRKRDGAKKGKAERRVYIEIRQIYSRMDKQNLIKAMQ